MDRRLFMQQAGCISGTCLCGFSTLVFSAAKNNIEHPLVPDNEEGKRLQLVQDYLGMLLINLQHNISDKQNREVIKQLSQIHFKQLNMDEMLKPFNNDLKGFINFLEKDWGWKVNYNKKNKSIIADENKNYCVCPMINHNTGIKHGTLCYCSEGFAEQMFSKVVGHPVKAKVIESIQRGDKSCKYQIVLS